MTRRDPIFNALLSLLVPFYILYWFFVTATDLRKLGYKAPSTSLLVAWLLSPLLLLIALIPIIFVFISTNSSNSEELLGLISVLLWLSLLLFVVLLNFFVIWKISSAIEQATQKQISALLLFIVFWVFAPVSVYLAQDALNKLTVQPTALAPQPVAQTLSANQPQQTSTTNQAPALPAKPETPDDF